MAQCIVIANQKGGVGKTTTAVNLSAALAVAEKRTLMIDLDPQSNSTSSLVEKPGDEEPTVYDALVGTKSLEETVVATEYPFLSLVRSLIKLVGAEIELVEMEGRETLLAKQVKTVADKYDYIVIDCPPSLGLLTLNGLTAADGVLIPIQAEYYALEGMTQLMGTIKLVQRRLNPRLTIFGILLTMYDPRLNLARQVQEELSQHFPDKLFKTVIRRNVRLAEAPSFGKPVIHFAVSSQGAADYIALAAEIIARKGR